MATNDKYDRQLRLWGARGQRALGDTCVVLVGATAAGTETLKNLVLPGIGSFCVVDDALVTKQDASSNFFIPDNDTSHNRAEVASKYLQELNPDVKGAFQVVSKLSEIDDWKTIFDKETNGKKKLTIIASDLNPQVIESLSRACDAHKLALLVVQSYGLIGNVRLQLPGKVPLLEPKPTNAPPDLRLKTSFPALDQFVQSVDLNSLENHQHGHVPYPIILKHAATEWRATHDNKLPSSFTEKQEFKEKVKGTSRDYNKELNFQEAIQNAYLAYTERDIVVPEGLDPSSSLGLLYQALETFMNRNQGRPPLNGSIPDMTASTDSYVALQKIYKTQAEQDLQEMISLCDDEVSKDDIVTFCANVFSIDQISTRTLVEEFHEKPSSDLLEDWQMNLMDPYEVPAHTPILWYLGIRACQVFFKDHQRYPGISSNWESDIPLLQESYRQVAQHYQLQDEPLVQEHAASICHELTRYANAEIHTVASVVGGVASQEAVKIITGQYTPLNNTYVYNGIVSVAGVYKF
jgi:amyloid beta precursor protein binding protein 1